MCERRLDVVRDKQMWRPVVMRNKADQQPAAVRGQANEWPAMCDQRPDVVQVKPVRRRGKPDVAAKVGGQNNKKALKTRFAGLSLRFI